MESLFDGNPHKSTNMPYKYPSLANFDKNERVVANYARIFRKSNSIPLIYQYYLKVINRLFLDDN